MPKVTMEFNTPEDNYELELAQKAYNFKSTLDDLDTELRKVTKYGSLEDVKDFIRRENEGNLPKTLKDDDIIHVVYAIRSMLSELRADNNANMDNE